MNGRQGSQSLSENLFPRPAVRWCWLLEVCMPGLLPSVAPSLPFLFGRLLQEAPRGSVGLHWRSPVFCAAKCSRSSLPSRVALGGARLKCSSGLIPRGLRGASWGASLLRVVRFILSLREMVSLRSRRRSKLCFTASRLYIYSATAASLANEDRCEMRRSWRGLPCGRAPQA